MDGSTLTLLVVYCLAIVCSSLLGGVLPSLVRLTHTRLQLMISLIGGLMLGVGLLHQLPHAVTVAPLGPRGANLDWCLGWMLAGLVGMFFLLRFFHFHHHEAPEVTAAEDGTSLLPAANETGSHLPVLQLPLHTDAGRQHPHDCSRDHDHDAGHDHDHSRDHGHDQAHDHDRPMSAARSHAQHHDHDHHHDHGHGPGHSHGQGHSHGHAHAASWMGVAIGLSLHTLFDGVALAAHVKADALHNTGATLLGLGTFLGIVLHKPLDSLSITSLMVAGGWSATSRQLMNGAYSLMCPLGALLFCWGLSQGTSQALWTGSLLAFSAGLFVCIALSDLLPEIDFHSHDRLRLSAALVVGVVLAWGIGFLEPEHSHGDGGHDHTHSHGAQLIPIAPDPTQPRVQAVRIPRPPKSSE